jgi:uncharacterized protein with ATP-grasp and redox domains
MAGADHDQQCEVVFQVLDILKHIPNTATPPEMGTKIHEIVREITGHDDPYQQVKEQARSQAIEMLPQLREMALKSDDPIDTALRLSIAGNIMDYGLNQDYELWDVVNQVLKQEIAVDDSAVLRSVLRKVDSVLILGDNTGESVFDRLLIETLEISATYAVRGGPVLNDTTREDALAVGIDKVAEIIDNGCRVPGTILSLCSATFRQHFSKADLILAKGMGNYESLSEVNAPIFFLFKVKCATVSRDIGAPVGSIVIKQGMGIS